ncbi:uncharacterized protein TRIADDRAFT_61235 [Trichoplax adhaerens]|uniref:Gephyrin n=1 Tax=Trichoplax adhaerens TaxID=10228 RepID=B3SAE9_TRIAD|nr:hypothetical protein TRIADDRAFT_61235 [Trichoplax adhaerens]EDV20302.1 hypothetical protein TRIADDRAFT_61235 [Trichoplax adhaerens]|eukprot:XP_002117252.1 hypothetical protein TRIADDRAFT_61235 [Trichoplax adhaerens]
MSTQVLKVGVLTVSDRCSNGSAEDKSGPNLIRIIREDGSFGENPNIVYKCVADEVDDIKAVLLDWSDNVKVHLILTTGGTGFAARDVTPEATSQVIDREAPGLVIAMITKSLNVTPMAMLSRPVCGFRKQTLIVNFPGSMKGSQECFEFIKPALPHALDLIQDSSERVVAAHKEIQSVEGSVSHTCPHGRHHKHKTQEQMGDMRTDQKQTRSREDFYKVAERARQSPFPMLPVQEAIKIVLEQAKSVGEEQTKNLLDAHGRVLASDVYATDPVPPFPASIKDGYAVVAADGPGKRSVIGPITAGDMSDVRVKPGCIARISTGAVVPEGADAVVQVEDTELFQSSDEGAVELSVKILSEPKVGQDIRPVGFDIKAGEKVLSANDYIGSAELGILATVGCTSVKVYKSPLIAICSTGNEVCDPGVPLGVGQIRDSNRFSIISLLKSEGFETVDMGIIRDSPDEVSMKFKELLSKFDVIVTSGGVSMGEKDYLKGVLRGVLDATIHFGRVFMKPGKPTTFATASFNGKTKLIFCLPGNPVSAVVTCHLFVIPALRKMAGYSRPQASIVKAKLGFGINLDARPEYHRTVLSWPSQENLPIASTTGSQCSSRITSMRSANALLMLPPKQDNLKRLEIGSIVDALMIHKL